MRYDDMKRTYPNIDYLLSGVSDFAHDPTLGASIAMGWAEKWIRQYVAQEHQQPVTQKVQQFIKAIS